MVDGSVRAGAFDSFVVAYSAIPGQGDERTGRKQILSSVSLTFSGSEAIKPVLASMEIIDVRDGTSSTLLVGERPPSRTGGDGNDTIISGFGNDIMMGFIPGQALLATIYYPVTSETGASVGGHVRVFSGDGGLLLQSPEHVIRPGEFLSIKIDRNEIPLSGDPVTNRANLRIKPLFKFESERPSPVLVSFEIVDNSTGKTLIVTGHQCLVF
jgi:hypothetical protein